MHTKFDSSQSRMIKALIIERALERESGFRVKRVGLDGQDHQFESWRIETKFVTGVLQQPVRNRPRANGRSGPIRVKNMRNRKADRDRSLAAEFVQTFDYMLIIDVLSAAYISYEGLLPYVVMKEDGIEVQNIPFHELEWIVYPGECRLRDDRVRSILSADPIMEFADHIINQAMTHPCAVEYIVDELADFEYVIDNGAVGRVFYSAGLETANT